MNFNFTEDQLQFKDAVKSFLTDECTPKSIRDGWSANNSFNQNRWDNIAELGVLGSNLSEEDGGLGMDQVALTLMVEEMGYAGLPEPVAEQTFLINDLMPLLPGNIKNEVDAIFQSGNQYIAVAHPLSPNPLFLNNAEGLLLFNHDSYQFILKEDVTKKNAQKREITQKRTKKSELTKKKDFFMKLVHNEYTKRYFLKTPAHTIQMKPIYDAFHLNNKVTVHEII